MRFDPFDVWCLLVLNELQALTVLVTVELWLTWQLCTLKLWYGWRLLKIRVTYRWIVAAIHLRFALLPVLHLPATLSICARYAWLICRCFLSRRRSAAVTIAKLEKRANWHLVYDADRVLETLVTRLQAQQKERSEHA